MLSVGPRRPARRLIETSTDARGPGGFMTLNFLYLSSVQNSWMRRQPSRRLAMSVA